MIGPDAIGTLRTVTELLHPPPSLAEIYQVLWCEPMPRYQPFTAWTFPGHEIPTNQKESRS